MNSSIPPDRSNILTEQRNPRTMDLHRLSVAECVEKIRQEDAAVLGALHKAGAALTEFINAVEPCFLAGGRLIYIGAGTSGRLGVLDASEAPPTFQVEPGRIIGLIAGGDAALRKSSEGAEDNFLGAQPDLIRLKLTENDTLLGLAAGGTTPFVLGALQIARQIQSKMITGLLVCSPIDPPPDCDHLIVLPTGPEVLTGSTRMKAGTATKMALNTISTTLMIRSGRVYQNLMVDLRATNDKLRDRAVRIVMMLTGFNREAAFDLLERADGQVKVAVVMQKLGINKSTALSKLAKNDNRLDKVLNG